MNYLWAFMILIGVVFAAFTGKLPEVTEAALDSAKEAVTLCITMTGVMAFWVGLMKIAEKAGIIAGLAGKMKPVLPPILSPMSSDWDGRQHLPD